MPIDEKRPEIPPSIARTDDILHLTQFAIGYQTINELSVRLDDLMQAVDKSGALPFPGDDVADLLFSRSNPGGGGPCIPSAVISRFLVPAGSNVAIIGILHLDIQSFVERLDKLSGEVANWGGTLITQAADVAGIVAYQRRGEPWICEVPFTLVSPQRWPRLPESTPR